MGHRSGAEISYRWGEVLPWRHPTYDVFSRGGGGGGGGGGRGEGVNLWGIFYPRENARLESRPCDTGLPYMHNYCPRTDSNYTVYMYA
jgi:hypothetical protein